MSRRETSVQREKEKRNGKWLEKGKGGREGGNEFVGEAENV